MSTIDDIILRHELCIRSISLGRERRFSSCHREEYRDLAHATSMAAKQQIRIYMLSSAPFDNFPSRFFV